MNTPAAQAWKDGAWTLDYSAHFLALDVQPLLGEARAQLESEPEAHRAKPFFIRGWIEEVEKRAGREGEGEFHGRLLLEDKSFAHFITKAMPVGAIIGDFILLYIVSEAITSWKASAREKRKLFSYTKMSIF